MQTNDETALADRAHIKNQLDLLSAIEPSDSPLLSCYLDTRDGEAACRRFLDERGTAICGTLHGAARRDFETALEMVRSEIGRKWHPDAKGLAIFARSLAGGRLLTSITTAFTLENRLTFYRVPDLVPLVDGLGREASYTLILARRGLGIQVVDLDAGNPVPRAWLALPGSLDRAPEESGTRVRRWGRKRHVAVRDGFSRFARRVLAAQAPRPIVVAGDASLVDQVSDLLPQRSRYRLLEQLDVPGHLAGGEAVVYVRERMQERFARRADGMARRVVRAALRAEPSVLAGAAASLEMLRAGVVKTLLVAREQTGEGLASTGSDAAPTSLRPVVELVRNAVQRGVTVVVNGARDLHDAGGVACLLTETTEFQLMPEPASPRQLGLVA